MPDAVLPTGSQERKDIPLVRGLLDYFPAALAAVAEVSRVGNEKHNPGQEMHHARGKSTDHADCIVRHLVDRGTIDPESGLRHSAYAAWRALALLQEELEAAGEAPLARGARAPANTTLWAYTGEWRPPKLDEWYEDSGNVERSQAVEHCVPVKPRQADHDFQIPCAILRRRVNL